MTGLEAAEGLGSLRSGECLAGLEPPIALQTRDAALQSANFQAAYLLLLERAQPLCSRPHGRGAAGEETIEKRCTGWDCAGALQWPPIITRRHHRPRAAVPGVRVQALARASLTHNRRALTIPNQQLLHMTSRTAAAGEAHVGQCSCKKSVQTCL